MIIPPSKSNIYIKNLPFQAVFDQSNMTVSFSGYVVNCFDNTKNDFQEFEEGCNYFLVEGSFDVEYGDYFYVDARYQTEYSLIKKISKNQIEVFPNNQFEIPVLIWKAPDKKGGVGQQFLSENIFIQDFEACRRKGLKIYKDSIENFKFESGFVVCPIKNFVKYFPEFSLSSREDYMISVDVSIEISDPDPTNKGNVEYIKDFSVDSASLVPFSEKENDKPYLSWKGNSLSGTYYLDINNVSGGVVILNFAATEVSIEQVGPGFETQVRGAKFYKNGVSTSPYDPEDIEGEGGHYLGLLIESVYDKFIVNEDGVEPAGEYVSSIRLYVENQNVKILEVPPTILSEINEEELGEDEIIIGPKETIITPEGNEISSDAYSECESFVKDMEWTPINSWNGDSTVTLRGAGKDGSEDKFFQFVIHAERRFKKVGGLSVEPESIDALPEKFKHYSIIQWSDATDLDISADLDLDKEEIIYIDKEWKEIEIKEDGIFGLELIMAESELPPNEFLVMDITKYAVDKYQSLEITTTSSAVV